MTMSMGNLKIGAKIGKSVKAPVFVAVVSKCSYRMVKFCKYKHFSKRYVVSEFKTVYRMSQKLAELKCHFVGFLGQKFVF